MKVGAICDPEVKGRTATGIVTRFVDQRVLQHVDIRDVDNQTVALPQHNRTDIGQLDITHVIQRLDSIAGAVRSARLKEEPRYPVLDEGAEGGAPLPSSR
jgi:hypothetical protein